MAVIFHLINARLFEIGIFPWLAIAATTLFLPPDWPRRALSRFRPGKGSAPAAAPEMPPSNHPTLVLSLLAVYAVIQLLVPLRHVLYPGSVDWTYEGHRFSWRMKLHNRDAWARFHVMDDNSGQAVEVNPSSYVSHRQAAKMATSSGHDPAIRALPPGEIAEARSKTIARRSPRHHLGKWPDPAALCRSQRRPRGRAAHFATRAVDIADGRAASGFPLREPP